MAWKTIFFLRPNLVPGDQRNR